VNRSALRPGLLASLSALALALSGCVYGFAGGGLPGEIRTVAVLPFDNLTPEPLLTREILGAVRDAMENQLGLRPAGEQQADAIVRGIITRYEPDLPVAFTSTAGGAGQPQRVDVTRRLLQITVTVQILDQKAGKTLWERSGLVVEGDYATGREADGRKKALDRLVENIVQGAQSQW